MRLNNKGVGLVEVLTASMIISIILLSILTNILDMYEMNVSTQRRNTAYNLGNEVYHILGSTNSLTFEDDISPSNLVAYYDLENCHIQSGTGSLQKILNESTCVDMLNPTINGYEYRSGDISFYVYEQDQNTMTYISNNPDKFHKLLVNKANEIISQTKYDTSQIFRISIIVKYGKQDNYTLMVNGYLRR